MVSDRGAAPDENSVAPQTAGHHRIRRRTTRLHGRITLTRAVHKTGRKRYVEMTFALVRDNQGVVCGRHRTGCYRSCRTGEIG